MIVVRYPQPNGVVGGSIPGHEIFSLLDKKKLAMWPRASPCSNIKTKTNIREVGLTKFQGKA